MCTFWHFLMFSSFVFFSSSMMWHPHDMTCSGEWVQEDNYEALDALPLILWPLSPQPGHRSPLCSQYTIIDKTENFRLVTRDPSHALLITPPSLLLCQGFELVINLVRLLSKILPLSMNSLRQTNLTHTPLLSLIKSENTFNQSFDKESPYLYLGDWW